MNVRNKFPDEVKKKKTSDETSDANETEATAPESKVVMDTTEVNDVKNEDPVDSTPSHIETNINHNITEDDQYPVCTTNNGENPNEITSSR